MLFSLRVFRAVFFAIIFSSSSCFGQNYATLHINILNKEKYGIPWAEVQVVNQDTSIIQKTDLDGILKVEGLKQGHYKINVSALGSYPLKDFPVHLNNQDQKLTIELSSLDFGPPPEIDWEGGIFCIEDKDGNYRCIKGKQKSRIKKKVSSGS